jgi:siroheme synthase
MGGRTASTVAARLLDGGREPNTPVAVIVAATTEQGRIRITDLHGLRSEGATEAGVGPDPVLLVIGDVVGLYQPAAGAVTVEA